MYACVCKGVPARVVRQVIETGAETVEEVGARCGAGTRCGTCIPDLKAALQHARSCRVERTSQAA